MATQKQHFDIFVSDYHCSPEEWKRAMSAPASELPSLSPEQKEVARKMGVQEEGYRRGMLAGQYGNKRMQEKGQRLGELAEEILEKSGKKYRIVAVVWEPDRARWLLRVETPGGSVGVPIPFELVDDVLDAEILQELHRLRKILLSGVSLSKVSSK